MPAGGAGVNGASAFREPGMRTGAPTPGAPVPPPGAPVPGACPYGASCAISRRTISNVLAVNSGAIRRLFRPTGLS